jgi:hypothetical protein
VIPTVAKRPKVSKTLQQTKKTVQKHEKQAKQAKAVQPAKKAKKSPLALPKKCPPAKKKESGFAASAKADSQKATVRQFKCYGCCKTFHADVQKATQKDGGSNSSKWWWCSDMCRGFGYVKASKDSRGVRGHDDWKMVGQPFKHLLKEGLPAVQKRVPNKNALVNPSMTNSQRRRNCSSSSSASSSSSSSSSSDTGTSTQGTIAVKQQALLHYTDFCSLFEETRELAGAEREHVKSISAGNLGRIYGETMPPLVHQILVELDVGPTDTFLNIGSGLLNVVLQAAFTTGADCIGVEVDQERFQQGEQIYREFKKLLKKLGAGKAGEKQQSQQAEYQPPFSRSSGCDGNDNSDPTCDRLVLGGLQGPSLEHCWGDITQKLTEDEADGSESGSSGGKAGGTGDEESGGEGGGGSTAEKRSTKTKSVEMREESGASKGEDFTEESKGEAFVEESKGEDFVEDGYDVEHRFGSMLKKATVIYMNNYDGTFGTRENAGAQGDKQR